MLMSEAELFGVFLLCSRQNFQWSMKNFSPGQQFVVYVKANRIFFLTFIA